MNPPLFHQLDPERRAAERAEARAQQLRVVVLWCASAALLILTFWLRK